MAENTEETPSTEEKGEETKLDMSGVDKKIDNVQAQLKQMNDQFAQQMNQLAHTVASAAPTPTQTQTVVDETDESFIDMNPKAFKNQMREEWRKEQTVLLQQEQRKSQALVQLSQDYPELSDTSGDMHKKVLEAHSKLNKNLQDTPEGYELAVGKAAKSLGLLPKSARKTEDNSEFTLGGSKNMSENRDKKKKGKVEISEETKLFSRLMGRDPDDPKIKAGLEKAISRDTFGRYR